MDATTLLGRLERVDPRAVWIGEASHFTPWLAAEENLRLLAEAVGMELELEAQEKQVGPFRADILCKDIATDRWVLIENQLARTDHVHLGQLLTYAAGLRAVTIVWIAHRFAEEHRAALDWLNEITDKHINFFGIEVEVWRIGDSRPAPKFNIVSQPNNWTKSVSEAATHASLTEAKELQLAFWTAFVEAELPPGSRIRLTKPQPQAWMSLAIGRSGFRLVAIASLWDSQTESYGSHEVRAELVIDHDRAKDYFALLERDRPTIDAEVASPLTWQDRPDAKSCKIYLRRSADLSEESSWPELHAWLLESLEKLDQAFRNRIRNLDLEGSEHNAMTTDEPIA